MPKPAQLFSILLATSVLLAACAGVTRLPARAKGPAGESLQEKKPDLAVLDAPGSRREDVARSFASIDTGYQNPRLLWARWSDSKWGYWWVIAGNNTAAGDAGRLWHPHNLLVSFGEDGTIRSKKMFDDSPSLWLELHAELAGTPSLELAEPVHVGVVGSGSVLSITLRKDKIVLERNKKKNPTLEVSPRDIVRFSHSRYIRKLFPGATCHTLHFGNATSWGKSVLICAAPSDVATLFQYLQQEGSPVLRWD